MWAIEESIEELSGHCVIVHLFKEVLYVVGVIVELVGADLLYVSLIVALFIEQNSTEVFGEHERSIVARGQHHSVEELLGCQDVTFLQFGSRATNVGSHATYLYSCLRQLYLVLFCQVYHSIRCHHFA